MPFLFITITLGLPAGIHMPYTAGIASNYINEVWCE